MVGWCPVKNLEAVSCAINPRAGGPSVSKAVAMQYRSSFTTPGMVQYEMGIIVVSAVFAYCK